MMHISRFMLPFFVFCVDLCHVYALSLHVNFKGSSISVKKNMFLTWALMLPFKKIRVSLQRSAATVGKNCLAIYNQWLLLQFRQDDIQDHIVFHERI